jgi:hypothetical protein
VVAGTQLEDLVAATSQQLGEAVDQLAMSMSGQSPSDFHSSGDQGVVEAEDCLETLVALLAQAPALAKAAARASAEDCAALLLGARSRSAGAGAPADGCCAAAAAAGAPGKGCGDTSQGSAGGLLSQCASVMSTLASTRDPHDLGMDVLLADLPLPEDDVAILRSASAMRLDPGRGGMTAGLHGPSHPPVAPAVAAAALTVAPRVPALVSLTADAYALVAAALPSRAQAAQAAALDISRLMDGESHCCAGFCEPLRSKLLQLDVAVAAP